jgi:hypothetical protein
MQVVIAAALTLNAWSAHQHSMPQHCRMHTRTVAACFIAVCSAARTISHLLLRRFFVYVSVVCRV